MKIELLTMSETHLDAAAALSNSLCWPHRREDWQQALRLGAGVVALADGRVAGTALSWQWGPRHATVGLVVVDPLFQGQGIGKTLMQSTLDGLGERSVHLHATAEGQPLYEKLGFTACGQIKQCQTPALRAVRQIPCQAGTRLRDANASDALWLSQIDSDATGLPRSRLIADLLHSASRVLVLEEQDKLTGFACLRRFGRGRVIGPVAAACEADAKVLISALLAPLEQQFVRIDSDVDAGLIPWLQELGMDVVDSTTIMCRGLPRQTGGAGTQRFALMSQAMA